MLAGRGVKQRLAPKSFGCHKLPPNRQVGITTRPAARILLPSPASFVRPEFAFVQHYPDRRPVKADGSFAAQLPYFMSERLMLATSAHPVANIALTSSSFSNLRMFVTPASPSAATAQA